MSATAETSLGTDTLRPVRIVDCDVHPYFREEDELLVHMPDHWRRRTFPSQMLRQVYLAPNNARRQDSYPTGGGPSGSDPSLVAQQLLGDAKIDLAIFVELLGGTLPNPEHDSAYRSAINSWMAESWLGEHNVEGRHYGSITVNPDDPTTAVREIETWAEDDRFVQVQVPHATGAPFGADRYLPVWEAASRHRLPVCMHHNSGGIDPMLSPVGFVRHSAEFLSVGYPLYHSSHMVSLLCSGVFEKLPDLRFVFIEGGFAWAGPVIWHLERRWRVHEAEVGRPMRRPAEMARDHLRFTSQPMEETEDDADLPALLEMLDADELLMFASDYPHWDFDDPVRSFPRVGKDSLRRILAQNAIDLYGLPSARPVGIGDA